MFLLKLLKAIKLLLEWAANTLENIQDQFSQDGFIKPCCFWHIEIQGTSKAVNDGTCRRMLDGPRDR